MNPRSIIQKIQHKQPTLFQKENIKKYAILIPLLEINGETHLLFEVRALHMRYQPGDISFPGGRVEKSDPSVKYSALRETSEELGISTTEIFDVFPLNYMMPRTERIIYPFVGRIKENIQLSPNQAEVEKTFTVPLKYFLETEPKQYKVTLKATPEKNFPYHLIFNGKNYNWGNRTVNQYFYTYKDYTIWGLTAKIILNFLSTIKET